MAQNGSALKARTELENKGIRRSRVRSTGKNLNVVDNHENREEANAVLPSRSKIACKQTWELFLHLRGTPKASSKIKQKFRQDALRHADTGVGDV